MKSQVWIFSLLAFGLAVACPYTDKTPSFKECPHYLQVDLNDPQLLFWDFLAQHSNFSIPNPTISSYWAYQTRQIMNCQEDRDSPPRVFYCSSGKIGIQGPVSEFRSQLVKIIENLDSITRNVLYSPRKYSLPKDKSYSPVLLSELIDDYNIDCIQTDMDCSSIQLATQIGKPFYANPSFSVKEPCNLDFSSVPCSTSYRSLTLLSVSSTHKPTAYHGLTKLIYEYFQ